MSESYTPPMSYKPRTDQLRFSVGQKVRIVGDLIMTSHKDRFGIVTAAAQNPHSHTLDKYTIKFPEGDVVEFWEIQIDKTNLPTA